MKDKYLSVETQKRLASTMRSIDHRMEKINGAMHSRTGSDQSNAFIVGREMLLLEQELAQFRIILEIYPSIGAIL